MICLFFICCVYVNMNIKHVSYIKQIFPGAIILYSFFVYIFWNALKTHTVKIIMKKCCLIVKIASFATQKYEFFEYIFSLL